MRHDVHLEKIMQIFSVGGYAFDEVRALYQPTKTSILNTLSALKTEASHIIILTEKAVLPIIKEYIGATFSEGEYKGGINGAAIYQSKNSLWFVASLDDTETGVEYIEKAALPYLQQTYGGRAEKFTIRAVGVNEAHLHQLFLQAQNYAKNQIAYNHVRVHGEDVIEIHYNASAPKMLIDDVIRLFVDGLGDCIYAVEDVSLEEQLVRLLKLRGQRLSVAESFTGGGIARRIVSVSGASEVYFEGLNTYAEGAKVQRLGVSEATLRTLGAVSDQTAYEMASGLLQTGNCSLAIATTGLAGPKSDKSNLPVGLCFIAIGVEERVFVYRYQFDGTREEIIEKAINHALFLAYKQLKD